MPFPSSPILGQTHHDSGTNYVFTRFGLWQPKIEAIVEPSSVTIGVAQTVRNEASRLSLTTGEANGVEVFQADTGKTWRLVKDGNPSLLADWVEMPSSGGSAEPVTVGVSQTVRNEAERLALTAVEANGVEVFQVDTGKTWRLVKAGNPAVPADWAEMPAVSVSGGSASTTITVADATARLALTEVGGAEVLQADTGAAYRLLKDSDPAVEGSWVLTRPPVSYGDHQALLFDDETEPGISPELVCSGATHFTAFIKSKGVTLGALVELKCLDPEGAWVVIHVQQVTKNEDYVLAWSGSFKRLRAEISDYNDGSYDVSVTLR